MKEKVEKRLGILLSDEEFHKAEAMADIKLRHILKTEGDLNGQRLDEEYRGELIYESALHNAFAAATKAVALAMQDMKNERLENQNARIDYPYLSMES